MRGKCRKIRETITVSNLPALRGFCRGQMSKMCLCSYKRALAKTKQQDPARHSSVFKKERGHKSEEERRQEKERKREKYMNSKMPKRPDVTKLEASLNACGAQESTNHSHHHHSSSFHPPPLKAAKREREGDTDHVGEITQLKEKIAALEKQCGMKDRQLITKDQEITQMKAKVFNEERLIREKMKQMAKSHEDKVNDLQKKTRELQNEISRMRRENNQNPKKNKKVDNLFKQSSKPKVASRTTSPMSRSRSRSPVRSRSGSKPRSASGSRSASPAAEATAISTTTISTNDNGVVVTALNGNGAAKEGSTSPQRSPSRSPSVSSRSRSSSPIRRETIAT